LATTNFVDNVTLVPASWLNDVDDIAYRKSAEWTSVTDPAYGAVGDGVTDDTTAIQAALAAKKHIYFPPGTYLVSSSLVLTSGHTLRGAGRTATIIESAVIGDSLFKTTASYAGFIYMADMQLLGNGLTGASGNGHAINLIDPAISSGSFTPAQSMFERLYIQDFLGLDVRDNSSTAVDACAIINVDGLGNVFRDISIENCGHGIYLHLAQNCRIHNPLITGCTGWGIHTYDTENTIIYDGDVNTCGTNGVTDPTGRIETGMGTGNVLDARNEGFLVVGMKMKGSPGTAQIHSFISSGEIASCWIRADHSVDKEYIGALVTQPTDVHIHDNEFSPAVSTYSATRKLTNVKAYQSSTHNIAKVRINGNQFRTQGGTIVRANVHLLGFASATRMEGIEVSHNGFGMPISVATAATVDTDVLLDTGAFANCLFKGNNHYTETDVTKTAHYELTGGTFLYNEFDCNSYSSQTSGAIAPTFSGFNPWVETVVLNRTYTIADSGRATKSFVHSDAGTPIITIPANSSVPFPVGTKLPPIINLNGAGAISIAITTDTMRLAGAGTTGTRSLAANGVAYLEKVAATEWIISGTGVT